MQQLISQILEYVYTGSNVTVVSFPDDGLAAIYELLEKEGEDPTGYDPNLLFCPFSFQYFTDGTLTGLENELNATIALNYPKMNNIIDVLKAGHYLVVLAEDLHQTADLKAAVAAVDGLVKKYRGRVRFVHMLEDPLFMGELQRQASSVSVVLDAIIYNQIGKNWDVKSLSEICIKQFHQELTQNKLDDFGRQSACHYGIFKRMYRDELLGTNHTEFYVDEILGDLPPEVVSIFKKVELKKPLDDQESKTVREYQRVGFINDNKEITIPMVAEKVTGYRIKNKVSLVEEASGAQLLKGIDLDLLTKAERSIVQAMMRSHEEVTKDEISEIIWGDKADEFYSEWAIDQRMSRLKRKLRDLGFNIDIKTVYGKGYKLVQVV